jgi:hypothetical protein
MTTEQIKELAEQQWTYQYGFEESDKQLWVNGFAVGYMNAKLDRIDQDIQVAQNKVTTILVNGNNCDYSGLPSVKSYENK